MTLQAMDQYKGSSIATALGGATTQMPSGRGRLGSSSLLEPITALDEIELAQQLKKR